MKSKTVEKLCSDPEPPLSQARLCQAVNQRRLGCVVAAKRGKPRGEISRPTLPFCQFSKVQQMLHSQIVAFGLAGSREDFNRCPDGVMTARVE